MDVIMAALEALGSGSELRRPPAPQQPPQPPKAPAPAPPVQAAPPLAPPRQAPAHAAGLLQGLFEDGNSLLRAVIAAEVLQPPLALRETALWIQQPNEPSI
jgi:hypothetical protein